MTLRIENAQELISRALAEANGRGETVTVAVVDRHGVLVALARGDGAAVPSVDVAIGKAYTAGCLGVNSGELQTAVQPGGPLFGLLEAVSGPLVVLPGGVPVRRHGQVVAGLGVGGSAAPQTDEEIAAAAVH